jgi:type III restriction enzyme
MADIRLKNYQLSTLDVLKSYLEQARYTDAKTAYVNVLTEKLELQHFKPYQPLPTQGEGDVPYVCLRLPTGGGKTLLSAYTIQLAAESYIERDYPLTLWFVPSDAIKVQTLETLKNPRNANRVALDKAFEGRFQVFDIEDFEQIRPQDLRDRACVIVSTFAAFRVEDTTIRKVYAHNENLEPHFSKISSHTSRLERFEDGEHKGQLKFSLANLLAYHQPLVIVDEAHNAKSDLSVEMFSRINPACMVEYTATPASNSNVLYSVSAAELKAEKMIKLPIMLSEHTTWQMAVAASVLEREKLQKLAEKDKDYIRPIVLLQAESKGNDVTVEVLLEELTENNNIDPNKIAIATGDQKGLDNINLFDPTCLIEYVITIQALKEGWDCPFAYILCSVANTRSPTAIEQLLGRILRMPYADLRSQDELNRAYAHVSSKTWVNAQNKLYERLISMGFEEEEAKEFTYQTPMTGWTEQPQTEPFSVTLSAKPDLSKLDLTEQAAVEVEEKESGEFTLKVTGPVTDDVITTISKTIKGKDKKEFQLAANIHKVKQEASLTPAQKGIEFSLPQLALRFEDGLELAEPETCLYAAGWELLDYPSALTPAEFSVSDDAKHYIADIEGKKVKIGIANSEQQLSLDGIHTPWTELELSRWLDKRLKQPDVKQADLLEFLRRMIAYLLQRSDMDMPKLVQGKFLLEKVLREKINEYRVAATKKGFQQCLLSEDSMADIDFDSFSFNFDPNQYPANRLYEGMYSYGKHYYPRIADMNGQEADFAFALDKNPLIEFWVRNLERQPYYAFWLPTSSDKFYPDFVAKLKDGRMLVVEYKGAHLLTNDDTKEKQNIGMVWAEKSGNLFLLASENLNGLDFFDQINNALS